MRIAVPGLAFALPMLAFPAGEPLDPEAPVRTTAQVLNLPFLDGTDLVPLRSTTLEPGAAGQARVRGVDGRMRIHAHFKGLEPAHRLGPEYLTYVLWAITPSGRAANLGEVVPYRGKAHVEAMTNLPTFSLLVSAEPHFAVTRVSHAVVLETSPRPAGGPVAEVSFERLGWGAYKEASGPLPGTQDRRVSPYVFQARNALRIARLEQAPVYASDAYRKAEELLIQTEAAKDLWSRQAVVSARLTAQQAEEARLVAAAHRQAHALTLERERAQEALAKAREAQAQAEFAKASASRETSRAQSQEQAATETARQATQARLDARAKLLARMNALLRTQETPEGLKATLTGASFPSGRGALTAPAKVHLAKVAGILLVHPGLKIKVLGHTDATGRPETNARLSRERAEAVRRFLVEQGLPPGNLEAQGLDSSQPLATNDTPQGRRLNRRVELIVRGEPIGI